MKMPAAPSEWKSASTSRMGKSSVIGFISGSSVVIRRVRQDVSGQHLTLDRAVKRGVAALGTGKSLNDVAAAATAAATATAFRFRFRFRYRIPPPLPPRF